MVSTAIRSRFSGGTQYLPIATFTCYIAYAHESQATRRESAILAHVLDLCAVRCSMADASYHLSHK